MAGALDVIEADASWANDCRASHEGVVSGQAESEAALAAVQELRDAGDFLAQVGPTDGALRRWARAKEAL